MGERPGAPAYIGEALGVKFTEARAFGMRMRVGMSSNSAPEAQGKPRPTMAFKGQCLKIKWPPK